MSEEARAVDPPATGRGRVLRRATSGEPVRPVKVARRPKSLEEAVRQTRAAVAKKKASASSLFKHAQIPPSFPPPADADAGVTFDFGSLSPRRMRKAAEEEVEDK